MQTASEKIGSEIQSGQEGGRIGTKQEWVRCELISVGKLLRKVVEPAGKTLIDEVDRLLIHLSSSIAVIGQIKAGKSCIINSLIGQPEFLPTDVNPSTSAITRLHFNQVSPTGEAAIFRFFTQEEWERLADGTGRLRYLTERLVPGFQRALLRQSISQVKLLAASRLGPEYERLLGRSHAFNKLSHDILSKYVCAGEAAPGGGERGRYSEITRSADLYLDKGPFDFPVTIIDTPGTNDPFLIRDEVTRSCLDKADAYLVVLSAQQPLSEGDVSLLRILRGLNKERIAIIVNRVDELGDPELDTAEVVEFVKRRLASELPGFEIPIIAGSARLMHPTGAHGGLKSSPTPRSAADGRDLVEPAGGVENRPGSGTAELSALINRMIASTRSAYLLRNIARSYKELAEVSSVTARDELARLTTLYGHEQERFAPNGMGQTRGLRTDQTTFMAAKETIERTALNLEVRLRSMLQADLDRQRNRLSKIVHEHASTERHFLIAALLSGRGPRAWTCDVDKLRLALRSEFENGFERSKASLIDCSSQVAESLARLIEALTPGGSLPKQPRPAFDTVPTPNPSSLGQALVFDLNTSLWSQFWRSQPMPEERGEEIERLVQDEFSSVVEGLVAAHADALDAYIDTTVRWLIALCHNALQMLTRQREWMDARHSSRHSSAEFERQLRSDAVTALELRHAAAESALEGLSAVCRSIERW